MMLLEPEVTLVEPSVFLQQLLVKNLKALDMRIKSIYTQGQTALENYKADQPDMLIVDHLLPDMSGIAFAEKVLTQNIYASVILLIPDAMNYETQNYIARGVKAVLVKPFYAEALQKVLIETISNA